MTEKNTIKDYNLNNNDYERTLDFLKYSISYVENRIAMIDNKASILIAVQGVLFASLTYIIKELFLTTVKLKIIRIISYIILSGAFIIFILVILLLLQTIRPSKRFFGLYTQFYLLEDLISAYTNMDYIMWFSDKFPGTLKDYFNKINSLDLFKIRKNYEITYFISLCLIKTKYKFYRWAIIFMKLLVLWSATGLILLSFLKWYYNL